MSTIVNLNKLTCKYYSRVSLKQFLYMKNVQTFGESMTILTEFCISLLGRYCGIVWDAIHTRNCGSGVLLVANSSRILSSDCNNVGALCALYSNTHSPCNQQNNVQ